MSSEGNYNAGACTISIVEQPKQRGLRFRYKCEGRSAGSIPGENTSSDRKTYPSIKIDNYEGPSAIVVVSCVTKDPPHFPHPHNLVGQDCRDGVCTVKVKNPHAEISFPNIGIQCCKRHDVEVNLKVRENIRVDPFGTGYPSGSSNIDLNTVRLCFQVFLPGQNKKYDRVLTPVVSNPIIDKKSVHDLVICRLSRQSGCVSGGDEVFLLCEKINKDDIKVCFSHKLPNGESWEAEGEFTSNDVHRQYALIFKTPPYHDLNISEATTVFIQLHRPSDDEFGDPKPFLYTPLDTDPYHVSAKKRKKVMTSACQLVTSLNSSKNPIPRMITDEFNKDENEVDARTNGSSFVKNKLKEKIGNRIPEHLNLPRQDDKANKRTYILQLSNDPEVLNSQHVIDFCNNNNENDDEIKNIDFTATHLNNINNENNDFNIYNTIIYNSNNNSNNNNRIEVAALETICFPPKNVVDVVADLEFRNEEIE